MAEKKTRNLKVVRRALDFLLLRDKGGAIYVIEDACWPRYKLNDCFLIEATIEFFGYYYNGREVYRVKDLFVKKHCGNGSGRFGRHSIPEKHAKKIANEILKSEEMLNG